MKAVEYCQEKKKVYCLEGVSNFDAPLFFYRKLCPIKLKKRSGDRTATERNYAV